MIPHYPAHRQNEREPHCSWQFQGKSLYIWGFLSRQSLTAYPGKSAVRAMKCFRLRRFEACRPIPWRSQHFGGAAEIHQSVNLAGVHHNRINGSRIYAAIPLGLKLCVSYTYEDGTPYYLLATTCYVWNLQSDEMIDTTLQTLKDSPFNKIRF